jgi:hypothetical protein
LPIQVLLGLDTNKKRIAFTDSSHSSLTIKAVDERRLKMGLQTQEGRVIEREYRGKLKEGVFVFKTRYRAGGVPPLFWGFGDIKNAIGVDANRHLTLYDYHGGMVFIGILPVFGTSNGGGWMNYKQIE